MKNKTLKPPVTRLNKTFVELSNGVSFTIFHNFAQLDGPVNSFDAALQSWLARTDEYTDEDFCKYVGSKEEVGRIFVTQDAYNRITEGRVIPATKEEFDAENN